MRFKFQREHEHKARIAARLALKAAKKLARLSSDESWKKPDAVEPTEDCTDTVTEG